MNITREFLIEQRDALRQRVDQSNAMANKAAGALAVVDLLLSRMDEPEPEEEPALKERPLRAVETAKTA